MQNYFKKTLAGIFAVAIVASSVPLAPYTKVLNSISITASAYETEDGLVYEIVDDSITITGYSGTSPNVVIPAEIGGKPVKVIGEGAFRGMEIQTIVLNEGLEQIEDEAFWESSITSVTFPKSLRFIGSGAFVYCKKLDFVRFLNSNCEMESDAYLPFVDWELDYGGCFLKTVYCPTGSSDYYCMWGFNGNHEGCDGAWTFVEESPIPDSTLRWSLDENGVMTISGDDEAFPAFSDEMGTWTHWCDAYSNVTSIVFETPYLTSIGSGAFADFTGLTSLELPDTVESIGKDAFNNCSSLASVELPAALLSLGQGAFFGCSALEEVVLPSAVTTIGQAAFGCCSKLISVTIPKSVKSIDDDLFFKCDAMETVNYTGTADEWNAISFGSSNSELKNIPITYVKAAQKILDSELTWEIDNGVMTISGLDEAFPECWVNNEQVKWCDEIENVKKVVFNTPNLKNLGSGAFLGCENLESIELPNSLTTIGDLAFEGCTNLTGIDFPENLTTIGASAFYGCTKLESIVLPNSVTTLGECVFGYCDALSSVKLSENITSLPEAAFVFTNIESFEIPAGITEIGAGVFIGCMNMKEINVAADNSAYCSVDGVLFDKEKETLMQYPTGKTDSSYIVQDTVTSIQEAAFACNTSLTDITLPSNLTKIECETFGGSGLTSITIPDSVNSIGFSAFEDCEDLTSVMIPDSVTEIEHSAFRDCSSLTRVTIPAFVSAIGQGAFQNTGLKSVTFECDDAVAIANFNSEGVYDIFEESVNLETIYVPVGCVDAYKNSEGYQAALGDYIDLIQEMPTAEVKGYSVSYNGDITINFHYLLSDSYKNGYVEFSDGTQVIASVSAFEVKDANGYYVFPISMPAKNMYDEITAQFYDANDVAIGEKVEFTLTGYMKDVKEYDPNYSDFVDSFLEYGRQAVNYFRDDMSLDAKTYSDDEISGILDDLETNGYDSYDMPEEFVGATLLLKSKPILRLYFKEEFGADGYEWKTNDNEGLHFDQKEIALPDFSTAFHGYSIFHYIYRAISSTKTDADSLKLKSLCAALYEMNAALK